MFVVCLRRIHHYVSGYSVHWSIPNPDVPSEICIGAKHGLHSLTHSLTHSLFGLLLAILLTIIYFFHYTAIPEFRSIVGGTNADSLVSSSSPGEQQTALRDCFSALMKSDPETVKQEVEKLVTRLKQMS